MTVGIMQPYFFPYLGYFQLFGAVDKFVLLDDVNYIVKGYINRNSILLCGAAHRFTIPIEKPSRNKLINETRISSTVEWKPNLLNTIKMAYSKAPCFEEAFGLIKNIVDFDENDLTRYLLHEFAEIKDYLGMKTELLVSSQVPKDNCLRAQDRIIAINKSLKATRYINPIGGQALYDRSDFLKEGIELSFIKMDDVVYRQFKNEFVPNLSMIDVLMFNSKAEIRELLARFCLI